MRRALFTRHVTAKWVAYLWGIGLTTGVGLLLLFTLLGEGLTRLSYDLPFLTRMSPKDAPEELVMVYFDPGVKRRLQQPVDQALDRRFHARLLERLQKEGAKLVLFDVLFEEPSADPETDTHFANTMRQHGRVVLAAESVKAIQANFLTDTTIPPTPALQAAAAGYGLANVHQDSVDAGVRRLEKGTENNPS